MNELEQYIRTHAAQFNTEEPAPDHEARFLAKTRSLFRPAPILAFAFAALAAVILVIRPGDPFRSAGNDPTTIYLAYMDQVAGLYERPSADSEARDALLQLITEEEEPLFTQLPEELPRRVRGRILREHYGRILAAAREIQ